MGKFGLEKLETWRKAFRYLEPFRRDSRVWQTDSQTDGQTDILAHSIMPRFITLSVHKAHGRPSEYLYSPGKTGNNKKKQT